MTNKELVKAFYIEGYVNHNYDFLMQNIAADYLDHSPCAAKSNAECVNVLKCTEKMFSDMQVNMLDMIEENDKVAVRVYFTGIFGNAPIGKKIGFEALEIFRIENGLIAESWGYWPDEEIKELIK
jgi:predicted ester cyclase